MGASRLCMGAAVDASRCSVLVGRSGRAPVSGAIAAISGGDSENLETRAGDSLTSGNLETDTGGVDAVGGLATVSVCALPLDDGVDTSRWATRCMAGGSAIEESLSGSGEDSALSWTGTAMLSLPLWGRGPRASGKSNRGSSASTDSLSLWGRVASGSSDAARCTLRSGTRPTSEASVDSLPFWGSVARGRSIAARCTLRPGSGPTGEASIGSLATGEASSSSVCDRGGRGRSVAARCTLRSGTRLIGAPSPMRRDWPSVSRWSGADGVSAASSPELGIVKGVGNALERCATGGSGVGSSSGDRLTRR